jgi:hypothetical protein
MPSDASRSLEYSNIAVRFQPTMMLMLIGSDKQGAQHYLIFGVRYPRDDDGAKGIIKNDIFDCLNYVS